MGMAPRSCDAFCYKPDSSPRSTSFPAQASPPRAPECPRKGLGRFLPILLHNLLPLVILKKLVALRTAKAPTVCDFEYYLALVAFSFRYDSFSDELFSDNGFSDNSLSNLPL